MKSEKTHKKSQTQLNPVNFLIPKKDPSNIQPTLLRANSMVKLPSIVKDHADQLGTNSLLSKGRQMSQNSKRFLRKMTGVDKETQEYNCWDN